MVRDLFDMGSSSGPFTQMMKIEKFVDTYGSDLTIGSMLSYTIVLENIADTDLESVCLIEDLVSGLRYKKNTLKINGIKPFGGDIDLDENVIVPIGIMRSKSQDSYTNSKIVITFNAVIDKIPCQYPIFNYARVIFKYSNGKEYLTGIETSNNVLVPFNLEKEEHEFIKLIHDKEIETKGLGDEVQYKIIIEAKQVMESTVLYDYLDKRLELISVEVNKKNEIREVESSSNINLNLGYINTGEIVEVLINARIKDNQTNNYNDCSSGCDIISNQASVKFINPYNKCSVTRDTNTVYLYVYYASLSVSKYANKENVNIGDIVTYEIKLKHCGSTIIENVVLEDKLPQAMEYVEDSAEIVYYGEDFRSKVDYNPLDGTIKIPIIDIGEEVIIYLKGKVISGKAEEDNKIISKAYLTYSYLKYPEAKNPEDKYYTMKDQPITKTEPIYIDMPDLFSTLKKEALCDCSCTSIQYKISFTNTGNVCAKNVKIKDIISSNASLDTSSLEITTNRPPGKKQYKGVLPNIIISEVHPGEKIVMTFDGIINSLENDTVVENYAHVSYQYLPCNCSKPYILEEKTNTTYTRISRKLTSSLTINSKEVQSIEVDQEALFRVEIKNTSSEELKDVVYKLNLTQGYSQFIQYKENSLTINGQKPPTTNINPNNTPIVIGTIKPNQTIVIEFIEIAIRPTIHPIESFLSGRYSYKLNEKVISCTDLTNKANLIINAQKVKLVKEAYSYCPPNQTGCIPKLLTTVSQGERITYKISVINVGGTKLEDVMLEDILPQDVKYVPNTIRINGVLVKEDSVQSIYLGNINLGDKVVVEFDVIIDSKITSTSITNKACVNYYYLVDPSTCKRMRGKSCTTNNLNIKSPNFKNTFAKYVEKIGQVEEFKGSGENINYIIQFKNEGNEDAFNVVLSDTLPEGIGYFLGSLKVTPGVPAENIKQPSGTDRLLQIKFDTVPVGKMYTVKWTSPIKSTFKQGDIVNNANLNYSYVSDSQGQIENENITSNNVVTHVTSAKVEITKSATPTITDINVPINYKIEIKNTGNIIANNIFLRDFLPTEDLEYIPGTLRVNGLPSSYDINTGILIGSLGAYNPQNDSPKAVVTYQLVAKETPKSNPIENKAQATYTYIVDPINNKEKNGLATSETVAVYIKAADLELIKPTKTSSEFVVSNTDPARNSANFEINLVNSGNVTALDIVIQDTLPNGLKFVPNTVKVMGYDRNGNQIQIKVNSIPPGGSLNIENGIKVDQLPPSAKLVTTFTYVTDGSKSGFVNNTANYSYSYITSETIINKPNNNTDIATVLIVDDLLDVKKFASPQNYCPGDTMLYTVNIRNISGSTISNVIFQDTIPSSTKYLPGTFTIDYKPITINGNTVSQGNIQNGINIGNIPLFESRVVQFQVRVSESNIPNTISNTGVVGFIAGTIPSKLYKSTVVSTLSKNCPIPVPSPIDMNKTAFSYCSSTSIGCKPTTITNAGVGDRVTYKVTVSNIDSSTVSNVIFKDILPSEVTFVQDTVRVNGVTLPNANPTSINLGTIPANKTYTVEFDVMIKSIPNNNVLLNTANTNYQYIINCPTCSITNGSTSTTNNLVVSSPDLLGTLKKYVGNVGVTKNIVAPGSDVPYIIEFKNRGNLSASDVVLTDVIPQQLTYKPGSITVTPNLPAGSIIEPTPSNKTLRINFGTVANNQSYSIRFNTVSSTTITSGIIVNSAKLSYNYLSGGNLVSISGDSNKTFTTISTANVEIEKSASDSEVGLDTPITYTLKLINTGSVTVNNLFIKDILPPDLKYVEKTLTLNGAPVSSNPENGLLLGSLGIYNPSTQTPKDIITFKVIATSIPKSNPITNIAKATYTYVADPSTGKEISGETESNEEEVSVYAADLLTIPPTKVSNKKVFVRDNPKDNIGDYTVTLNNSGNRSALNVKLVDTLPNGLKFIPQSVTVTGYDKSGNIVALVVSSIPPGGSLDIEKGIVIDEIPPNVKVLTQYSYEVKPNAPSKIDNIAEFDYSYVSADTIVNKNGNFTNVETINIVNEEGGFTKKSSPEQACPGQSIVYTLTMDNTFGTTISNAILQDTIPCGTCFVPCSFTVDFKTFKINGKEVTVNDLEKGVNIGTIPAGAKVIAQYQAVISCKCHPNPVINKAQLIYDGGKYEAEFATQILNSCICNCSQYSNQPYGTDCDPDCSMCWNKSNMNSNSENLYNKSNNKNPAYNNLKKIGKNTARANKSNR